MAVGCGLGVLAVNHSRPVHAVIIVLNVLSIVYRCVTAEHVESSMGPMQSFAFHPLYGQYYDWLVAWIVLRCTVYVYSTLHGCNILSCRDAASLGYGQFSGADES